MELTLLLVPDVSDKVLPREVEFLRDLEDEFVRWRLRLPPLVSDAVRRRFFALLDDVEERRFLFAPGSGASIALPQQLYRRESFVKGRDFDKWKYLWCRAKIFPVYWEL